MEKKKDEEKREEEEEEEKKKRREVQAKTKKVWNFDFCMDSMILVWIYGTLRLCMGNGLSQKLWF